MTANKCIKKQIVEKKEEEMNLKTANDVIDAHVDLLAAKVQLVQSKNLNVKYFCRLLIAIYGEQAIKFLRNVLDCVTTLVVFMPL